MSPAKNPLAFAAIVLALLGVVAAADEKFQGNLRKNGNDGMRRRRRLRRERIVHGGEGGLEEEVAFWTDIARRTQEMSMSFPDGGDDDGGGIVKTISPTASSTSGSTTFGTTAPATSPPTASSTSFSTPTLPPNPVPKTLSPMVVTPAPNPAPIFNCPEASFVGCTAEDITNPVDECDVVGELCPNSDIEYCCLDDCPRKYCTAKPAIVAQMEFEEKMKQLMAIKAMELSMPSPSANDALEETVTASTGSAAFFAPLPQDWQDALAEMEIEEEIQQAEAAMMSMP
mmetsp:Transcript_33796/g.81690  ORF Transcript_33796/g.81690 Transcript_33796/m.81690 type:complete len:285 (+) Transcript_33796:143-997(+)